MLTYTVYRYEKNGVGPYRHDNDNIFEMRMAHSKGEERPGLFEDLPIKFYKKGVLCAFSHLTHLKTWFDGWIEEIEKRGFKLYKIEVKATLPSKSGKQVFFHPDDIIKKEEYGSTDFAT